MANPIIYTLSPICLKNLFWNFHALEIQTGFSLTLQESLYLGNSSAWILEICFSLAWWLFSGVCIFLLLVLMENIHPPTVTSSSKVREMSEILIIFPLNRPISRITQIQSVVILFQFSYITGVPIKLEFWVWHLSLSFMASSITLLFSLSFLS